MLRARAGRAWMGTSDIDFPKQYEGSWVILFSHIAWLRTIKDKIEYPLKPRPQLR